MQGVIGMFRKNKNVIINKNVRKSGSVPDDNQIRLAGYYIRMYAKTLEKLHLTEEQKSETMEAVIMEYHELVSAGGRLSLVS